MLTAAVMSALWPDGDRVIVGLREAIAAASTVVFPHHGLTTDLAVAHAMAQFSQECAAGAAVEENLNYSAQGLMATWPARFDAAKAAAFAHDPRRIGNEVYNGRMGNRLGSDDGWTYRGRGGAQVTGRAAYQRLSEALGLDLVAEPDLANRPDRFLDCAVAGFVLCGCLPFALHDDVRGVTYHLNGGYTGLAGRMTWLARWKAALVPTASYGSVWVQQSLNALGEDPPLAVDGAYGPMTAAAVKSFQHAHALPADGKIGRETIAALAAARSAVPPCGMAG